MFGMAGTGDGQLNNAQRLTYNTFNSKIVCADWGNTRLQSFQYGFNRGIIDNYPYLTNPRGICFDKDEIFMFNVAKTLKLKGCFFINPSEMFIS